MRVTIEIPDAVHANLRQWAAHRGVSIRSLILAALEQAYPQPGKGKRVMGPMVKLRGRGKLGPRFPVDENPHDLIIG